MLEETISNVRKFENAFLKWLDYTIFWYSFEVSSAVTLNAEVFPTSLLELGRLPWVLDEESWEYFTNWNF